MEASGFLDKLEWGAHACLFFNDKEEAIEILVPYFAAGLRGNEYCMWVTSKPLSVDEAKRALARAVPDLDARIADRQIEIIDASEWYTREGKFDSQSIQDGWVAKLKAAIDSGFTGLRLSGFTTWLKPEDWIAFIRYEDEVGDLIEKSKVIAVCCYDLAMCDSMRVIEVVSNHHYALIKTEAKWTLVQNTERAKAVMETREVEEKYKRTAHNIGVAIYSALPDETSTTLLVTDRIAEITGYTTDEFYGDPSLFSKIVHPDDAHMVWEKLKEHREKRSPLSVEYRVVRKDGSIRWVADMAYPCLNAAGDIERIDGFMQDVTESRRTQEALRRSEERLALAQKAARIGSWDWDVGSGALTWSDEIEPMFGLGKGEFERTYEGFLSRIHPDDRPKVERAVAECVDSGRDYVIEHRIIWPNGSVKWISEKGNVVRDQDGKAIRMLGIAQDVTESKLAERRIKELNLDLEKKTAELMAMNRELEAFSYSVSHDLRAPLRRIEGFGQLLLEDAKDKLNDEEKDYLERMTAATLNMDRLISDLLRLSNVSRQELSSEKLDLAEIAREVVDGLRKSEAGAEVSFEADVTLASYGDRALVKIALTNLLENAWKFTSKTEHPSVEFRSIESDGKRVYFVRDNGAGFDSSKSEKLFKPFQRLHLGSEFLGNGIGLAIVSRIIERHGGKIWAESIAGEGATFYFTLGAERPQRA